MNYGYKTVDLVFISMTDEKPKKIKATLDRIDFKTYCC
jgi:hypothetical protein